MTLAGCAATVDGTGRDAGADVVAAQDAVTRPHACAWRALPAVDVTARPGAGARLVDAVATGDGAWVAYREVSGDIATEALTVARVDADGRRRGATATLFDLRPTASLEAWSDWDPARGVLALLAEGDLDGGSGCAWASLDARGARAVRAIDPSAAGPGFSRAGCRALLRTGEGYSFASEQIRAVWGTDLIGLSRAGEFTGARSLPTPEAPAEALVRTTLAGGDFVAAWGETWRGSSALRVRRFDELGAPRGPVGALAAAATPFKGAVVVETSSGMLALWEGLSASLPPADALIARPLDAVAQPSGDPVAHTSLGAFLGGLSATRRGDEVLATAVSARGAVRLTALALDARGVARATVDTGLADVDGPTRAARVVATGSGALVFATVAQRAGGGVVVAVPLRCE